MDHIKAQELSKLADVQIQNATAYFEARRRAGDALSALDLMVAASLTDFRSKKKNLGIELARLMLIENNPSAQSFFKEWQEPEARYKGLEKLLEAYATKISLEQSIMKFIKEGERYG